MTDDERCTALKAAAESMGFDSVHAAMKANQFHVVVLDVATRLYFHRSEVDNAGRDELIGLVGKRLVDKADQSP